MKKIRKNKIKALIALLVALTLVFPIVSPVSVNAENSLSGFAGGSGTEKDPYLISTKEQLNAVRGKTGYHYKLINDIVFSSSDFEEGGAYYNEGMGWHPIEKSFTGTFNGNGYGIYGLQTSIAYLNMKGEAGIFAKNNGIIKNLTVGSLVFVISYSENKNNDLVVGSVCGVNNGTIANCKSLSTIIAESNEGAYSGGIAGINNNLIKNCSNEGVVYAYAEGDVAYAGGIVATNYGRISNCANKNKVLVYVDSEYLFAWAGGIAGCSYQKSKIEKCYNTGEVYTNYDETGEFKSNSMAQCGGIVGNNSGNVSFCYNKGRVIGTSYFESISGGIAGSSYTYIDQCYNAGLVTNTVTPTSLLTSGGIAGVNNGSITNTYNCMDVGGGYSVGGIVGSNIRAEVTDSYNVGILSPINYGTEVYPGQIVGETADGNVSDNYICNELQNGIYNNAVGGGTSKGTFYSLSFDQMKKMDNFTTFGSVWTIVPGAEYPYPILVNMKDTKLATGISVTKMPKKTKYELNESFSNEGLIVTVSYDDGTSETVTDFVCSTLDSSTPGKKSVEISYEYFTAEIAVTVLPPATGIEIQTLPGRLNYPMGMDFSDSGMVVIVKYENNETEQITDYMITSFFDPNMTGSQTVTISYRGFTDSFEINVFDPEKAPITKGDTDFDLDIDSDDAIYLLYHVLFGEEGYKLNQECNFDGLGVLDSDDAIYLLYHVLFGEEGYPLK